MRAARNPTAPVIKKADRQPANALSVARGYEASRAPVLPTRSVSPDSVAKCRGSNHVVCRRRMGTKINNTPTPTVKRPMNAHSMVGANPKSNEPRAAKAVPALIVMRGPSQSDRMPAGTCKNVYTRK